MHKFDKQFEIESPTRATLNVYYCAAKGDAHGIVHINHGLAEHAVRYTAFAKSLSEIGFHVYAHDHRGHGFTKAKDAPQGVFSLNSNGKNKVLHDCLSLQNYARDNHHGLPLVMFGHSMGGLITMNFALRYADQLAGAAIWNANFDGGILGRLAQLILKYERFRLGSDVPSRILPKLTFDDWAKKIPDHRTNFDWLSHVEHQVDAYIADPLCGWDASVGMWLNIFDMVFSGVDIANAPDIAKKLPFLLAGGGEDPATNFGKAINNQVTRLQKSNFHSVSSNIFANARHETLNDNDAKSAMTLFHSFALDCVKQSRKTG